MKRTTCWLIALGMILAPFVISPLRAEDGGLVLIDEEGNEVLRLEPGDLTTGMQDIPAGRYRLKVKGPSSFKVLIGDDTGLEIKQDRPKKKIRARKVETQPLVIDFDLAPGDQGQRMGVVGGPGDEIELQLAGHDLPEVFGWNATIEYDPEQIRYVTKSFKPGDFIPKLMALEIDQEGKLEVGGASFSKAGAEGDGDLGFMRFEILDGFRGETKVRLTLITIKGPEATEELELDSGAGIVSEDRAGEFRGPKGERDEGDGPRPGGDKAVDRLREENACPGCDLHKAELMKADLRGADLRKADLSGANLFQADLSEAQLEKAMLRHANLLQVDLRKANLRGADLSEARLTGAKLQGADLTGAKLEDTKLKGAQLSGAIWIDGKECGRGSVGRCR